MLNSLGNRGMSPGLQKRVPQASKEAYPFAEFSGIPLLSGEFPLSHIR